MQEETATVLSATITSCASVPTKQRLESPMAQRPFS